VSNEDMMRWAVVRRDLSEVLTEVADGLSELVYMG
jgi:regulator of protease activity HflC (stomatin/prohibitin superfamily)